MRAQLEAGGWRVAKVAPLAPTPIVLHAGQSGRIDKARVGLDSRVWRLFVSVGI